VETSLKKTKGQERNQDGRETHFITGDACTWPSGERPSLLTNLPLATTHTGAQPPPHGDTGWRSWNQGRNIAMSTLEKKTCSNAPSEV